MERRTLVMTSPNIQGVRLDEIPGRLELGVTLSRVRHCGGMLTATHTMVVRPGARLAVVGTPAGLDKAAAAGNSLQGSTPANL